MKKILTSRWLVVFFFLVQVSLYAQDKKIKIYESKLGDGTCVIVFPDDPAPLMVQTGKGACAVLKTMAHDDWHEMSGATVVTTSIVESPAAATVSAHSVKSPRDAASGLATGKRQHKPILLSSLSYDALDSNAMEATAEVYSFSWGMSNSGAGMSKSSSEVRPTYDVKSNTKRTAAPSGDSCCSNGICTVTVSIAKKHTKTGHVTLLK